MKKFLTSYLNFTSRERNGAVVLSIIIVCTAGVKLLMLIHEPKAEAFDHTDIESQLALFEQQITIQNEDADLSTGFLAKDLLASSELFFFDPNTATEKELIHLCIRINIVQTILNYRTKGGKFLIKDDLKKIYGLSSVEYERLAPYIRIANTQSASRSAGQDNIYKLAEIDLNSADTTDLKKLKGIGSVLANRIIKYRELLGGFVNTIQIKEVYGISDSLYMALVLSVYTDTTKIKKINLNLATEMQLSRHPYIGKYYSEGIIQYRQHVQHITGINELLLNNLLPEEHLESIRNYLTF